MMTLSLRGAKRRSNPARLAWITGLLRRFAPRNDEAQNKSIMKYQEYSLQSLNWEKMQNLIPTIVQDNDTLQVLMLGYMTPESLNETIQTNQVTFYSRSKQRLWTKGETSGNVLHVVEIIPDCDNDSILILAKPAGPTCHLNNPSCFGENNSPGVGFLSYLEKLINNRHHNKPKNSYTTDLFNQGIKRIAQKVGEEGVEVALASLTDKTELTNESADLLFHLLVLLRASDIQLQDIISILKKRHNS